MKGLRLFCLLCLGLLLSAAPVFGAGFEFRGSIEAEDATSCLLAYYVNKFTPEELLLTIADYPDETGRFSDIYMDLTGVMIDGVRLDKLTFRMHDALFNAPAEWAAGSVECKDALQIYAYCLLKEDDINRKLKSATFGKDDHWRDIFMRISPAGLFARGIYAAKVLFLNLNISLEIESRLKILNYKELWLDDYTLRVNAIDVPAYVTDKALSQIQPLIDLGRFPLPLRLHRVDFQQGQAVFSTRLLPEAIQDGIAYHYSAM